MDIDLLKPKTELSKQVVAERPTSTRIATT